MLRVVLLLYSKQKAVQTSEVKCLETIEYSGNHSEDDQDDDNHHHDHDDDDIISHKNSTEKR